MANDHQVPQFYLRNFEIQNPPHPIPRKHIYYYERGRLPIYKAIKSVACEDDYYNIEGIYEEHSRNNNFILSTFENHSPQILRRILDQADIILSKKEKWILAYFVATLAIRSPSVHEFFEKQSISQHQLQIRNFASRKNVFYSLMKRLEPNISENEIEEMRLAGLKVEEHLIISLNKNEHNKSYLRSLITVPHYVILARRLFFYNWHLLIIQSDKFYVTSDNPVVFLSPRLKDRLSLWKSPVFLPINPKIALLIHPFSFANKKIFVEDDLIDFYVKQSVSFAKDAVFSHIKLTEIQKLFSETKQNVSDLNYQYNFLPEWKLKFFLEKGIIKV